MNIIKDTRLRRVGMLMNRLRTSFLGYKVDPDLVIAYRSAIPSTINLDIEEKGSHYIAVIKSIEKQNLPNDVFLATEADSQSELVDMVNDLILTYKSIPELYRPYYKRILTPEDAKIKNKEHLTLVKAA